MLVCANASALGAMRPLPHGHTLTHPSSRSSFKLHSLACKVRTRASCWSIVAGLSCFPPNLRYGQVGLHIFGNVAVSTESANHAPYKCVFALCFHYFLCFANKHLAHRVAKMGNFFILFLQVQNAEFKNAQFWKSAKGRGTRHNLEEVLWKYQTF